MRLESFQITNFRSIDDSGEVAVGDQVCLVGKNEAGKTAILHALGALNPHPSTPLTLDKERDYPRKRLTEYDRHHPDEQAIVIRTWWSIDASEWGPLHQHLGPKPLANKSIEVWRAYGDTAPKWHLHLEFKAVLDHLLNKHNVSEEDRCPINEARTTDQLRALLEGLPNRSESQESLLAEMNAWPGKNATGLAKSLLTLPSFMYFSHYDR